MTLKQKNAEDANIAAEWIITKTYPGYYYLNKKTEYCHDSEIILMPFPVRISSLFAKCVL